MINRNTRGAVTAVSSVAGTGVGSRASVRAGGPRGGAIVPSNRAVVDGSTNSAVTAVSSIAGAGEGRRSCRCTR